MKSKPHIIISGGHHNSALLIAKECMRRGYTVKWYGHTYPMKNNPTVSQEYYAVTQEGIPFIDLNTGKLSQMSATEWVKCFRACVVCVTNFVKNRPDVIISFGGYIAVPPVLAAWLLRIPRVTHEQTRTIGKANYWLLRFVNRFYSAWLLPEYEQCDWYYHVGLPIPTYITHLDSQSSITQWVQTYTQYTAFTRTGQDPVILISGGKLGSHFINSIVEQLISQLLSKYVVLHQTGNNQKTNDYHMLLQMRSQLPAHLQKKYILFEYADRFELAMQNADVIVGRSGAHTVYTALYLGVSFVAIPLQHSNNQEQFKNAQVLVSAGIGSILSQTQVQAKPISLLEAIDSQLSHSHDDTLYTQAKQIHVKSDSTQRMVDDISKRFLTIHHDTAA